MRTVPRFDQRCASRAARRAAPPSTPRPARLRATPNARRRHRASFTRVFFFFSSSSSSSSSSKQIGGAITSANQSTNLANVPTSIVEHDEDDAAPTLLANSGGAHDDTNARNKALDAAARTNIPRANTHMTCV